MGKPNHSFEKRRRELEKKKKKEAKRQLKLERKNALKAGELNPDPDPTQATDRSVELEETTDTEQDLAPEPKTSEEA